ncbi:LuxR C-terminal-related transcriptional regulator [Curtobacterium sp. NPDC090217]|uniref:LuxR C-terminal-related transcriptional regulator n=1 Tax=Curtobacterium sp. NPDC090217 TaxID=3363970 RepID=UPI003810B63D
MTPLPRTQVGTTGPVVRRADAPVVHRPRLVDRVERALDDGCPVVVEGPPRAGVTTLVEDWADRTRRTVVVVSAGAGDEAVTSAVAVAAAGDPDGRHALLVDDAHLLGAAGSRAVVEFAAHGALVLAGRVPGPDGIDDPVRIGPGDLALDAGETATLVGRAVGVVVAPAVVARATESAAGNAGVLAAASGLLAAEDRPPVDVSARFRRATDRAAAQWVEATLDDPGLRDFAERAATAAHAPADLVRHLTGVTDLVAPYRAAAAAGLGAAGFGAAGFGGDDQTDAFTWHPAVAAALRRAAARRDPEGVRVRAEQAVAWSLEHEATVPAIDAAVQLGDLDVLSDVLVRNWTRITGPGAPAVARILDPIQPRRAADHPVVLAAIARAEAAADRHHARASRVNAAVLPAIAARTSGLPAHELPFLAAVDAQARRIAGDDRGARRAAATVGRALAVLDGDGRTELAPRLPYVLQQVAATALMDGDTEGALATLAGIEPAPGPDGPLQQAAVDGLTAFVHALAGEVDVARRLLEAGDALDVPTGVLASAVVALEDGDPDRVTGLLRRIDPLFGAFEHWPIVLALRARATTISGRVPPADQLAMHDAEVQRFRLRSAATGVAARLLARSRIRLQLAAGQLRQAERSLDALGPVRAWTAAEHVALALARDEPDRALRVVTAVSVRSGYEARTSAVLVLFRAVALRRTGDVLGAVASFREALDLFERHGMRGELLTPPRDDVLQLVEAADDPRGRAYLEPLLGLRSVMPGPDVAVTLSGRESVVLGLLAEPLSLPEVAAELHVSVNTVKTQVRSVYRKLGVSGRREAVEQAHGLGLLGR